MRARLPVTVALAGAMFSGVASGEYDFFSRARYPGGGTKPGVDLYKVNQDGGRYAEGYERRVVTWWPRKGVDVIDVEKGMPLRTWTLRDRQFDPNAAAVHPTVGVEELTRRLSATQPRVFEAHLVGFRGVGNRFGKAYGVPEYYCPAVVLRLADGSKRCFTRGSFVKEDETTILDLYVKEMDKLRPTLSQLEYPLGAGVADEWSDTIKPGEPGKMRVESTHFVWLSGSQHAPNEDYSPWINRDEPEKAALYREGSVAFAENMWAYQEYAGVLMPYWDRSERRKYAITVAGTYMDGHKWIAGYAGGGYGGCGIKHAGGGPWSMGLAHEWGHGLPLQVRYGGGEILADACQTVDDPAVTGKFANNVLCPWRNCMHASYATGMFYGIMSDDPNWGYCMVITLPVGAGEPSVFHTLARLGEQRGLFENGIRGVGDMMGEFAARLAELDCELQDGIRRDFISVKRDWLEAVDRGSGLYRVPWAEAPEPYGANIIRLVPDRDAQEISVDFRGFYDPDTYGDWRACIVAVDKSGKARYSDLWNKGVMGMKIESGDRRFWLTVAATPRALPRGDGVGSLMTGRHAYRYPYEVKLCGCRPGTPHNLPGDTDDYSLVHIEGTRARSRDGGLCMIPHPGDSSEADIMRKALPELQSRLAMFKKETDRLAAADKISTSHWWYENRFVPHLSFLDACSAWMLDGIDGRRHPNGGGWVAGSAEVAESAYVAPDAMVLQGAKVLDHAALEDFAVVRGSNVVVSGHARLGGQAYVAGNVRIGGYTRVRHPIAAEEAEEPVVPNEVELRENQVEGEGGKLWAYYACDRDETEVLEDYFRYASPGHPQRFCRVILNGHLYGRPEFVVDGDRRGFRFDGLTQYAEASPILADLGEITVEMALKWEGGKDQAVFDFGTSMDNRFVLAPAGASGKAELAVTLGGKTERIVADIALPQGKWTECRVEIDGKKIVLWIDGRKAAETQSGFRPADAYPAGEEKRNFIAASRDGNAKFKGVLDYLRVWHTVYDDFTKAPRPRRHSPRRVDRAFIESCRARYGGVADATKRRDALIQAELDENPMGLAFYKEAGATTGPMKNAIENQASPVLAAARKELKECEQALEQRKREFEDEFDKRPDADKKRTTRHGYVTGRTAELKRRVDEAKMAVGKAVNENIRRCAPEHNWLHNLDWILNSGHYNYPYKRYINDEVARKIGIKVELCHENFSALEGLCKAQTETNWHTRCDWEWRLHQELDGSIAKLPQMRKWLERARGAAVTGDH